MEYSAFFLWLTLDSCEFINIFIGKKKTQWIYLFGYEDIKLLVRGKQLKFVMSRGGQSVEVKLVRGLISRRCCCLPSVGPSPPELFGLISSVIFKFFYKFSPEFVSEIRLLHD